MAWDARAQVLCVIFIAGAVADSFHNITLHVGDTLPASVITGLNTNVPCYLDTPQGDVIGFRPENNATDRFIYIESLISYCGANITNLTEKDEGKWSIYYINSDNKRNATTYNLTVTEAEENDLENSEPESESVEEESEEKEDITEWLSDINLSTRIGLSVDISLSKRELDKEETFTLTTPQDDVEQLEHANIPGVTVHGSSDFVASRVTIGPMDATLIGRWTLCGEIDEGRTARRCQTVVISWNNQNNPSATWPVTLVNKRNAVTNYLAIVETGVGAIANLRTCHLVTPNGEDLILTTDAGYPGITLVATHDTYACRVNLGPIQKEYLGDWILYASFWSTLGGFLEVRLPLHLFLYDEDDPYRQAYNVTTLAPLNRVVNLGTSTTVEIAGTGNTDSCEVKSPSGQIFDLQKSTETVTFLETSTRVRCAVSFGPIGQETLGEWEIIAKFNDRNIFTENRQIINIIQEDPENPIMEDHRTVLDRDMIFFNTSMGAEHSVIVDANALWIYSTESCHLRTPKGLQYTLMDGFNIPGIEIVVNDNNRCNIKFNVESEDLIGEWTLISREQRSSDAVEVRQPFTIYVQEEVEASARQVTVTEGNSLHLRLANPTNLHETCKLYDPSGTERTDGEVDASHIDTCGFIVKDIQNDESGIWQIRFGTSIAYRASVEVTVKDIWESSYDTLVLTRGRSVNETLGPETVMYCKLTDPTERVVYEGHGRCNLALDRVNNEHAGTWVMNVGLVGNLLTREYKITAQVKGSEDKPVVTTFVAKEQPEVTLKCSVPVEYEVKSCLFQEPSGRVIIVNDGVAEDRYISHGSGTTLDGDVATHECGVRITNPVASDLGLWRCAVETDHEIYYGFLSVLCPWAMQDPAVAAAVVAEPTLTAYKESITHLVGESLTMSCTIQSPIQYCYFRRPNGMTYSVSPGVSSSEFEYVGAGLDAGECGIRFSNLEAQESGHWPEGRWSCHVGVANDTQPEQRADMQVQIISPFKVNQTRSASGDLKIEGDFYQNQPLEYCRYVRIDGVGFKSTMLPDARYFADETLSIGHCGVRIENPTTLDLHPWTIAAKVVGKDEEVLGVTSHAMDTPEEVPVTTEEIPEVTSEEIPEEKPVEKPDYQTRNYTLWWCTSLFLSILIICLGVLMIPNKNRRNTIARATLWRDSIRRSLTKKPLPDDDQSRTTPMSA
ncbi:uncharacterized protein LOC128678160 [Plodia interpunctella]|uniref:uncharacterized protein LOC128678160 n=1 Tax=Plodia interpunctella TaxID=58824 RepID=UPI0023680676|nr:uncharacterized protein LOC128678160 [Plodia interpunctella]